MSRSKHTPGPWRVSESKISESQEERESSHYQPPKIKIYHNGEGHLRRDDFVGYAVQDKGGAMQWETTVANARLIAAAPELLAACEKALIDFAEDEKYDARFAVICDMFRDAVAEAKGGAA